MNRILSFSLSSFIFLFLQFSHTAANTDPAELSQPFATPELTWSLFKSSILNMDFDTAKKCCCEDKVEGVLKYEKMDAEKRKSIFNSMQDLQQIELLEDIAKYRLNRYSGDVNFSTFVYFEKIDNEWKISEF